MEDVTRPEAVAMRAGKFHILVPASVCLAYACSTCLLPTDTGFLLALTSHTRETNDLHPGNLEPEPRGTVSVSENARAETGRIEDARGHRHTQEISSEKKWARARERESVQMPLKANSSIDHSY